MDEIASSAEGILTNYERVRLEDVSKFLNKLNELGVTERVRGPLFSYIHVKEPFLAYSNAIKLAFRRNMFTFIAMDAEAFKIAKRIFDELNQPEVTVIRYDLITSKGVCQFKIMQLLTGHRTLLTGTLSLLNF